MIYIYIYNTLQLSKQIIYITLIIPESSAVSTSIHDSLNIIIEKCYWLAVSVKVMIHIMLSKQMIN